jgi:hypothetical protein
MSMTAQYAAVTWAFLVVIGWTLSQILSELEKINKREDRRDNERKEGRQ